jgi:hypothetical protein
MNDTRKFSEHVARRCAAEGERAECWSLVFFLVALICLGMVFAV